MKNIGIVTHDLYPFKPWGQGRYVFDLVNHLRPQCRRKIIVFSPSDGINDEDHVRIFPGSHSTLGKNISFSLKLTAILEKFIQTYNLGLVHFQGGPGGIFLVKKTSVPLVYTVHHTFYQQARHISSQAWKKLLIPWEKAGYNNSERLLSVSNSTYEILIRQYSVTPDKCLVIPNGVDQNRFFPRDEKPIPNSVFFLGRLDTRKGIDFLLKAIVSAKKIVPDIQLIIGGDGNLRPSLEKFARDNGLDNNVHFLGTISDADVVKWFNKATVVVVPSIFEGFGLTAIEAMACKTPVIASNVDGLCDVVKNRGNGLLIQYGDVEGLKKSIISLLREKNLRDELADRGLSAVQAIYNWDIIARQVLNVYKDILE